jgi:hypothetical protein
LILLCEKLYDHGTTSFHKLMIKDICLGQFWTFLVTKFQNHGSEMMTMDFKLWVKNVTTYRVDTNKEIEWFVDICIFLVMYHCYQVHCTKYPTISIHACTWEKKNHVTFANFNTHYLSCMKHKFWTFYKWMGIIQFSKQYLHTQVNICFWKI